MQAYARYIVRHRRIVLALALIVTAVLGVQLRNLAVIVDADELLPRNHPFVVVTERVQEVFGNRYTVVIGITPKQGDVFTPQVLAKVLATTNALIATPGITPGNIQSLAAPRAKNIAGDDEGLVVSRFLDHVPESLDAAQAIKARLAENPAYRNVLVSPDGRTAAIYAEFKKDPAGFGKVVAKVEAAVAPIRDDSVSVTVAGQPIFLGELETFSKRMGWLLPIAIVIIGLVHLEAFRTLQGLILPLVTAILALVWSLGVMTLAGVHLDPFNNVTPILILAVAAGHAVQMLKRYYEEFHRLRADPALSARDASREAVVMTLVTVGPVLLAACTIAALSFMSLAWFDIQAIRTFGIFCGLGIFSIAIVELTFTPALRAMLPPPKDGETHAERAETFWDRLAGRLAAQVETPAARRRVFLASAVAIAVLAAGASQVTISNSLRSFFAADLTARQDDQFLNGAMAGTNTFYVLVEGSADDAIKDPRILKAMEKTEAYLATRPEVGHTLSIVDMLKQINRGMNGGGAEAGTLPDNGDLIAQYLLLYSMSGEPGDFDGLVDYPYRNAIIQAFVKTDSSVTVSEIDRDIRPVIAANFPPGVTVRLGGSITTPTAMNEVMVTGKIKNILQIFVVVFIVSGLLFRSVQLAALILVPLLVTVLSVFGVMGFAGIPLQIATATMAALAVGIGADYAIYFAWRLREELQKQPDEGAAIRATYRSAGKAVMFVAAAVGGGYAVLMASVGFNIHLWLGFLTMTSMIAGATSTLTLFAALLLKARPRVVFGGDTAPAGLAARPVAAAALLLAGTGLAALPATPVRAADTVDATKMMENSLTITKPYRSTTEGRFVLTNKAGQSRVRETESVSELKADGVHNRRVVRFLSPADIKGTAVLTIENTAEDDIWVYLPALKKVRRLSAANKKDAFVGTDFSYGDVLGHRVEDWNQKFVRKDVLDGKPVIVIESTPKTPEVAANSGYSKRLSWLRATDAVDLKTDYYGPDGKLLKVYVATDIRLVDTKNKRYQPMRQTMTNVVTGHSTRIEYDEYSTDIDIAETQFQPRALERTP